MQQEQPYPQNYPPPGAGKKEGILKYILLGVGCFVVILAFLSAGGYFFYSIWKETSVPLKIVNAQLQALQENDLESAYAYCSSGFQRVTDFPSFRHFVQVHALQERGKQFASNNRSMSGNTVTLIGNLKIEGEGSQPAEYRLVKEKREWKIDYIKIDSGANDTSLRRESASTVRPGETLVIRETRIEKTESTSIIQVQIHFRIYNFENEWTRGKARIDLLQDLTTYGPDGQPLEDLSRNGIQQLNESGDQEYTYADFSNSLSIPKSYPSGTYTAELTVHDQIGGTSTKASVEFEFP